MKKALIIMLLVLICITDCHLNAKATKYSKKELILNCLHMYNEFLNGEISASSDNSKSSSIEPI